MDPPKGSLAGVELVASDIPVGLPPLLLPACLVVDEVKNAYVRR